MSNEHNPQSEYQIPKEYRETAALLDDVLDQIKRETILDFDGHPVTHEVESASEAPHAQVLHVGVKLAEYRQTTAKAA